MPELPEVTTIVRSLAPLLVGKEITGVEVFSPKHLGGEDPARFSARLRGKRITALDNQGKYILMKLGGEVLLLHLRLTGQLLWREKGTPREKHTAVVWHFAGEEAELRLVDARKFALALLLTAAEAEAYLAARLGVTPTSPAFTGEYLEGKLVRTRRPLKTALLDQRICAGVGNIYADEALFRAGLNPLRQADSLTPEEYRRLHAALVEVIAAGIAHGGTSVRDYVDGYGREGSFQKELRVYGRKGEPCLVCGEPITRTVVGGRGTFFCGRCQK